jgi:hypothetical protein
MINVSKAQTGFAGLVGFEDPTDPAYAIVSSDNKKSISGLYYTDNPLVKIQFLKDIQDYAEISNQDFNTYLQSIHNRSVGNVLNKVHNEPDYIDRSPLYRYANNKTEIESLPVGFKGYRIIPSQKNVAFEISRIIIELSEQATFTLYLFNSAKNEAVESKEITASSGFHAEDLGWVLDDTDSYFKGEYLLGYFADLKPYKREYDFSDIKAQYNGVYIEAVTYSGTGTTIPDLDNEESSELSFGLNPDITTYKDYTDLSIQNKRLFAKAVQLQGQINILSNYLATSRTNRSTRITRDLINQATVELEGRNAEGITKVGLKDKLKGEINHIQAEIGKLNEGYKPKGLNVRVAN